VPKRSRHSFSKKLLPTQVNLLSSLQKSLEKKDLVETKQIVNELAQFKSKKVVNIEHLFRLIQENRWEDALSIFPVTKLTPLSKNDYRQFLTNFLEAADNLNEEGLLFYKKIKIFQGNESKIFSRYFHDKHVYYSDKDLQEKTDIANHFVWKTYGYSPSDIDKRFLSELLSSNMLRSAGFILAAMPPEKSLSALVELAFHRNYRSEFYTSIDSVVASFYGQNPDYFQNEVLRMEKKIQEKWLLSTKVF